MRRHPRYLPTPAEVAKYDQALAEAKIMLDALIESHRLTLAEGTVPPEIRLVPLAQYLNKNSNLHSLAQLLAVAIDRLNDRA